MEGTEFRATVPSYLWFTLGQSHKEQDREWYFSLGTILRKVRTGKGRGAERRESI